VGIALKHGSELALDDVVSGVLLPAAGAHPGVRDGELRLVADGAKPFKCAVHAKGSLEGNLHLLRGNRKAGLGQRST
jgi:hypothetical protein